MKKIQLLFLLLLPLLHNLAAQSTKEKLSLASILQDSMVIQQGKPFTVWGTAKRGEQIIIQADWSKKSFTTQAKDGKWSVKLDVPIAKAGDFTPHRIEVNAGGQTVSLNQLLIGEVWICSGQSNMSMYMKPFQPWHNGAENYAREITAANYPHIRFLTVAKDTSSMPEENVNGQWQSCSPLTVATLSVVSYYFAKELFTTLNIPVGIVVSAYGGAAAQAFTPTEVLAADKDLRKWYLEAYLQDPLKVGVTARPALIYNAMIHPLRNLSIKGFIWYQGESNAGIRDRYPHLNIAMIRSWRDVFQQGELPFYFVQMPPYNWKKHDPLEFGYAMFREEQQSILQLKNTGMVCTMDLGDTTIVHPSRKRQIGERLGWLALNKSYEKKDIVYDGPIYDQVKIENDSVIITYKKASIQGGLKITEGDRPLHFFLAGDDRKFYPATASIVNNEIHLYSKRVKKPVAVRYAFTNYPFTNIANGKGIPAYPFRTDDWKDAKMLPAE